MRTALKNLWMREFPGILQNLSSDEIGKVGIDELRQRLDKFLVELNKYTYSKGYMINYGDKEEVTERKEFFEVHLTQRKFPLNKFVFANGEKEKTIRTRLWIVPEGSDESTMIDDGKIIQSECPVVTISPPPSAISPGETAIFSVDVNWDDEGLEKDKIRLECR